MRDAPLEASGAVASGRWAEESAARRAGVGRLLSIGTVAALLLLSPRPAPAGGPFMWDEDGDRIDDRMESVHLLGYSFAFDSGDTLLRKRIAVTPGAPELLYSVYVVYDHLPDDSDVAALGLVGMPVLHRYESVPAVRSAGSFAQVESAAALPGVERLEAVPVLHPLLYDAAGAIGVRDRSGRVFPTWESSGGADGGGVVVAFLDTGINDAPDGAWPGHESLAGRCLGGAEFVHGDSTLDTRRDDSVNPVDRGGAVTLGHGTHVASIAVGGGGASGYAIGIAPGARFVDVKVLNDAGIGTGVAEAIDWCIHNRARAWGGPPGFEGIDVINLSVSSLDPTDGNDLASRLANRAVDLGVVVVASMGNDGRAAYVPSPAGGDRVLAVGALDHQRSSTAGDDRFASFSNYGPRANDQDGDAADEQKPDLLAPSVAVLGADGDLSTDGAQYRRISGTSAAAAFVSGVVAALRSQYPTLGPGEVAALLRATGSRPVAGAPAGPGGPDPRWTSSAGFGVVDLYAARLEREQPDRSQIVRFELSAPDVDHIQAVLHTQRERGAAHFVFERAPDQGGQPGAFAPHDSVAAAGDPSLADLQSRTVYARLWSVSGSEQGAAFWYRVSYSESGVRYDTPARKFTSPSGASAATIELTIVHNAYDGDVSAEVRAGDDGGAGSGLGSLSATTPGLVFPVPASGAAVFSDWVSGVSTTGNVAWTFRIEVPAASGADHLPPTPDHPWRLRVGEGGYLNRSGRVTAFRVIWNRLDGPPETYNGGPVPQQTVEGQTVVVTVPQPTVGVGVAAGGAGVRVGPNPVRAGGAVLFRSARPREQSLRIFDLGGRELARLPLSPAPGGYQARWETRDAWGRPLASGIYFARLGRDIRVRLVVISSN